MSTSPNSHVAAFAPTLLPTHPAETQRLLAVVLMGGVISATLLVLIGLPALYLAASGDDAIPPTASVA